MAYTHTYKYTHAISINKCVPSTTSFPYSFPYSITHTHYIYPYTTCRVPSLFFICITQGIVGSLQSINSFPGERAIMLRERAAGTYKVSFKMNLSSYTIHYTPHITHNTIQVSAYFAAKSTVDMVTQTWPPILFSCIVYFLIGYQNVASKFFMFTFTMVLVCLAATSMATLGMCMVYSVCCMGLSSWTVCILQDTNIHPHCPPSDLRLRVHRAVYCSVVSELRVVQIVWWLLCIPSRYVHTPYSTCTACSIHVSNTTHHTSFIL
ncbi:hypothetical protein EON63_06365 [archaeon]|nr:MAG: hypothetical protein EON63_06365 [archaeon]